MSSTLLLLLLQAASPEAPANGEPARSNECKSQSNDEVVVCRKRTGDSPYRLPNVDEEVRQPPRAETQIAPGATIAANIESEEIGGVQSNRAMIRLKLKF